MRLITTIIAQKLFEGVPRAPRKNLEIKATARQDEYNVLPGSVRYAPWLHDLVYSVLGPEVGRPSVIPRLILFLFSLGTFYATFIIVCSRQFLWRPYAPPLTVCRARMAHRAKTFSPLR